MAFIARDAADQHIYVRRLDELVSHQVAGTEGARDMAVSPDDHGSCFTRARGKHPAFDALPAQR